MKRRVICILQVIIEIFIGSNTDEVINRLFYTMLQKFQEAKETSFERGSKFLLKMLIH